MLTRCVVAAAECGRRLVPGSVLVTLERGVMSV